MESKARGAGERGGAKEETGGVGVEGGGEARREVGVEVRRERESNENRAKERKRRESCRTREKKN